MDDNLAMMGDKITQYKALVNCQQCWAQSAWRYMNMGKPFDARVTPYKHCHTGWRDQRNSPAKNGGYSPSKF